MAGVLMTVAEADQHYIRRAVANAADVSLLTPPNPWVGAVVVSEFGEVFDGATEAPGGAHAEVIAIAAAGEEAAAATLYTTLEPCNHTGRTGPCTDAIIGAGIDRVVIGVLDPDPRVSGVGVKALEAAGIEVVVGVGEELVAEQLAAYLHHRRTGRPYVVLKLAATLDGRLAAPDGTSEWITGPEARADVHRLRAASQAIVVGAGTIRVDDPQLTVRDFRPATDMGDLPLDPERIVLGEVPDDRRVQPARQHTGDLAPLLDELGAADTLQVLVEGGAAVAGAFHRSGLVDRYVIYVAPALLGGDDGVPLFRGPGAATMADITRGAFVSVTRLGDDLRLEYDPDR